jgi:hypothetical protein
VTFPTPWVVKQQMFTGGGQDVLGNDIESWAAAVDVRVICYAPSSVESVNGYTSRVVSDVDLAVPPQLAVSVRDRFELPSETEVFEVVAIEDANHGFHEWAPGTIVKLKAVTG